MANLTSEQVKELADNILKMTNDLGDFRYRNFSKLTPQENTRLKELHNNLLEHTTELYTKSAVLVLDDAVESLDKIKIITEKTQELYSNLDNIQTGINWATKILGMASAILSLNTESIAASIKSIIS
ncbi:hypothetical protein [Cytophaga sp. FL35]|uniref:hypothetical protein n=1 Tax=Cytophaga sp. FL35 TaxID=1904456 RepID=UPI0016534565|nr:hypothetical protein [Cytophaga sp. FL35]MBC6998259.1 hypothetical protein [Cytophaga sp. FL35]